MLRAVSDSLYKRLINAFPSNHDYPRVAFSKPPMPGAVIHFLVQTLHHRANLETRRLGSEWFDTTHPDVKAAREELATALAEQGRIPSGRWAPLLKQVVDQVVRYQVRPVPTLLDFVFQGKDSALSASSLTHRVAYYLDYPYLREALQQSERLGRQETAELLNAAEEKKLKSLTPEGWVKLAEPLYALFEAADPDQAVPPKELLATFFEHRGRSDFAERLRSSERKYFNRSDLRRLLGQEQPQPATTAPEPSPAEKRPAEKLPPESSDRLAEESGPLPRWMQFQQDSNAQQNANVRTNHQPPEPQPSAPSSEEDDSRPLWMRFRPEPAPGADNASQLTAIENAVMGPRGPAKRDFFIERLFSGSEDHYRRTLERLQEVASWSEASRIIAQEVFRRHQVNIYSDPAVLFTDLVEARFKQSA